jgi:hypothetical protein
MKIKSDIQAEEARKLEAKFEQELMDGEEVLKYDCKLPYHFSTQIRL